MKLIRELFHIIKFIILHPLNKSQKIKAVINFFKWQISTRLIKKSVVFPWVDDARLVISAGQAGLTGNLYSGFMEYEDMIFLLHALQKSETFVDVGANAGAYTVLASKVIGSNSTAFEPIPETSNLLSDQVQINRIENIVEIKNMGVGDKQDELLFTNDSGAMNRVSLNDEAENTIRIKVTTLDSELNKDTNYFLKIDVEGYEYNVIEGASDLLASNKVSAIIIELNGSGNQFGHTDIDVHKKIISYGFIPISYNPINREIDQLDDIKTKNIGNTIYIRDIDAITERCKAAPIHTIHTAAGIKI